MAIAALAAFLRADPDRDRWMLSAPTAILAGWLTAASAVSTGVTLAGYGWLSDTAAAGAMLAWCWPSPLPCSARGPRCRSTG